MERGWRRRLRDRRALVLLHAHLPGPLRLALADPCPLPPLIITLDAVTVPIALQTVGVWIERASAIGAVQAGELLGVTLAETRVLVAGTLTVADLVLLVRIFVGQWTQVSSDRAVQATEAIIAVASTSVIIALPDTITFLSAIHSMP